MANLNRKQGEKLKSAGLQLPYNVLKEFAPVSMMVSARLVLAVNPVVNWSKSSARK